MTPVKVVVAQMGQPALPVSDEAYMTIRRGQHRVDDG
jgi:hypothetical protein